MRRCAPCSRHSSRCMTPWHWLSGEVLRMQDGLTTLLEQMLPRTRNHSRPMRSHPKITTG